MFSDCQISEVRRAFAIKLSADLALELPAAENFWDFAAKIGPTCDKRTSDNPRPANMPMKSFTQGASQRVITQARSGQESGVFSNGESCPQAFLNWLPLSIPLQNYHRPIATAVNAAASDVFGDFRGAIFQRSVFERHQFETKGRRDGVRLPQKGSLLERQHSWLLRSDSTLSVSMIPIVSPVH